MKYLAGLGITLTLAACGGGEVAEPYQTREITEADREEARAFMAQQTPLPASWTFERVAFEGDGNLRLGRAAPENPRATILFVPGYTSSPELASDFLSHWYDLGFEVAAVDLPGQGGSMRREDDPQKPYTGDFAFYGRSVGAAAEYLDSVRVSDGPLIVAGDSFGGHSVVRAAADEDIEEADGLFVLVPAIAMELDVPVFLAKFATRRAIKAGKAEAYLSGGGQWNPDSHKDYDYRWCGDREDRNHKNVSLQILNPGLRVGNPTNEWALGMVESGEDILKDRTLRALDTPMTMVTAGQDKIVANKPAEKLCDRNMPSCDLVRIEEATHCVYLEDEPTQMKVHDALLALLARIDPEA